MKSFGKVIRSSFQFAGEDKKFDQYGDFDIREKYMDLMWMFKYYVIITGIEGC